MTTNAVKLANAAANQHSIVLTDSVLTVTNTMLAGGISNDKLVNSTISGVALGSNLSYLIPSTGLYGTSYNGSSTVILSVDSSVVRTDPSGNLRLTGIVTATTFIGNLTGLASTATNAAVAYSWVGGTVPNASTFQNNVTFGGNVTFSGTATYVYSTNTVYSDNIIELHVPNGGLPDVWNAPDGKDIGFRFHYYDKLKHSDANAAFVLADDTQYFEFYNQGADSLTGYAFSGTNYATLKMGNIVLDNSTLSNSITFADNTIQHTAWYGSTSTLVNGTYTVSLSGTNELTVPGTLKIGQNLYVTGTTYLAGDLYVDGTQFVVNQYNICLLYTSPSPRDGLLSRMPSSA